ncbi:DUF4224 domain-containing protein [Hahella sp. HN01]|uniref:DUF4224 domain-containing protein n=1 Tax=Hahella sp. HN01 TaxID=2847262 RepID=UPI001C1ECBCF|nr:DUF4224 domain-containing protein [Hahella sp. HN01]MBU6955118.1 DUF4224 domain-containing protein [Hahella sp. HN01]
MSTLFLNKDEIKQLTGAHKPSIQAKRLQAMDIPYIENKIREVLVSRTYVESRLGNKTKEEPQVKRPNFEAIM